MKATYQIRTDEFEYVNIEQEVNSPEEAMEGYNTLKSLKTAPGDEFGGLTVKEFNACLDRYLTDGTGETEVYLRMNDQQKSVIQEVKKAYKRMGAEDIPLRVR